MAKEVKEPFNLLPMLRFLDLFEEYPGFGGVCPSEGLGILGGAAALFCRSEVRGTLVPALFCRLALSLSSVLHEGGMDTLIMNIYASSFHLCSEPARLRDLFDGTTNVAVIGNALDFSDKFEVRTKRVRDELELLSKLGLGPRVLDLREFFGSPAGLRNVLREFDGMWVLGGNVFILRRAMKYSGLDVLIDDWVRRETPFVYAGYSAGSCVLGPTLRGLHLVDRPEQPAIGYEPEVIWDGLGVLPYSIAPHFESDHPESSQINDVVSYFERHGMPYRTLRDGEAIVVRA